MKATGIVNKTDTFKIPGRETGKTEGNSVGCTITIACPAQLINQYKKEIMGSVKNGILRSFTSSCVIYSEEFDRGKMDYERYRQVYVGNESTLETI
jgi:hypothetical protein